MRLVALIFIIIAVPASLQAQALNSAVVGAARGIYRAEINGILSRGRYEISSAKRQQNLSRQQAFRDLNQTRNHYPQAQPVKVLPKLPVVVPVKPASKIKERELNAAGWQSF